MKQRDRSSSSWGLGSALVLAALLVTGTAAAETPPSRWDRAKQPEIADEYELHLTVQRILESRPDSDADLTEILKRQFEGQVRRALAMLQAAGAGKSANPLLRYDLAEAYQTLEIHREAADTYKAAMRDFPNHPLVRRMQYKLALACGHIGDHECESHMYRAIIAESTDPRELTAPSLNLAEADMHDRNLREAIEGYRETLRLCNSFRSEESPALAAWGLAVALDRAGEPREADDAAFQAVTLAYTWGGINLLTNGNKVFFFPEYEVAWYQGLTMAALAKRAISPKDRVEKWQWAERLMTVWVKGGEKAKDHWLSIAQTRLAAYTKERKEAEAALLKAPAEDPTDIIVTAPGQPGPPIRVPRPIPIPFRPNKPAPAPRP